jgi:hypothetical protein
MTVLGRWLGYGVMGWTAFRFRDAVVFQPDAAECAHLMYLVRGEAVHEFVRSEEGIDEAYARLAHPGPLPAVA